MKFIQTDCPQNRNGICIVSSKLADRPVNIHHVDVCNRCIEQIPPRDINLVTVDLGVIKLYNNGQKQDALKLRSDYIHFFIGEGPGTELIRIFKYIGIDIRDDQCQCEGLALTMNQIGSIACREKKDKIVKKIGENAEKRGFIWYSAQVAETLVLAGCDLADGKSWNDVLRDTPIIEQARLMLS